MRRANGFKNTTEGGFKNGDKLRDGKCKRLFHVLGKGTKKVG
jgi:hypothetical protein